MKNILLLSAFALLALGCTLPQDTPKATDKHSALTLRFAPPARTVGADWSGLIASYSVVLTNVDQGLPAVGPLSPTPANSPSLVIAGVKAGVWTITVTARDASSNIISVGTLASQTLPSAATLNVPLIPVQTGTGSFSYQVIYPDTAPVGVTSVTGDLFYTRVSGQTSGAAVLGYSAMTPTPFKVASTQTATFTSGTLPSGTYRLRLTFHRPAGVARTSVESINIFDNIVSDRWIDGAGVPQTAQNLSAADFNSTNSQLGDLSATVDGSPLVVGGSGFSSATFNYANAVLSTLPLVITPTESQPGQTIELSTDGTTWTSLPSGQPSTPISLTFGSDFTASLRVTATDGSTQSLYLIDFTIAPGPGSSELHSSHGGVWTRLDDPPLGTIAIAGQGSQLWAMTYDQQFFAFDGTWETTPSIPGLVDPAVKWLAVDDDGNLWAASPGTLYYFDGGWTTYPIAPASGLAGLAWSDGALYGAGADGKLYSWNGIWKAGPSLPANFVALGSFGTAPLALTSTQVLTFDGTWSEGFTSLSQAHSVTTAFDSTLILVVR